ncbi:MAG: hypothetical protein C0433_14440 [Cyclobacterium sp.]|nr:hypothetical protein [Cyclobacterium sp.]
MEDWKNPVIERQKFWFDSGLKNQYRKLIEGKLKFLFVGTSSIADYDKSIPPKVWSDFVDGIIFTIFNLSGKSDQFSESYIEKLTKPAIEEIIKVFKNPKLQKAFIDKYQFSTDTINLGDGIQTTIDAESLFRFNQLAKELVIGPDSLVGLRKKYIERKKKDYGLEGLSECSTKKGKSNSLTTKEKGIVLYFLMYHGSGDFKASRNEKILENHLIKLGLSDSETSKTSGTQVYKKAIVHLMTDADRDDDKKLNKERKYGVFSQKEFHNAIKFLKKKKDKKALIQATRTYQEYRNEKLDEDNGGGNDQYYFKDF